MLVCAALWLTTLWLALLSAHAQSYEVLQGDTCPECAPDEIAVRVWGEVRGATSMLAFPPCAYEPRTVLEAALARGEVLGPAFALRVPGDVRPRWLRDFLVSLDADFQHPLAQLIRGFTSECLLLGVSLEGYTLRGYQLSAASPRSPEQPCDPVVGNCPFYATSFSTTPAELNLGGRYAVAVFRNYAHPDNLNGADRTGILTVYLGPAP